MKNQSQNNFILPENDIKEKLKNKNYNIKI